MSSEQLLYVSAAAQFLSALWGGIVSLPKNDWPEAHPKVTIFIFVILGSVGMFATVKQGRQSAADTATATTKLSVSLDNLAKTSKEITRVQTLNTQLQSRLLEQSKVVGSLAQKTVDEITGGDSFPRLQFTTDGDTATPVIIQSGKAALPSLQVRIVDLSKLPLAPYNLGTIFQVPHLGPDKAFIHRGHVFRLDPKDTHAFNVFFDTDYRSWEEHILITKSSSGKWAIAFRIRGKGSQSLLMQCVHNEFPTEQLDEGDWKGKGCSGQGWRL